MTDTYEKCWKDYKELRNFVWFLLAGWIPLGGLVAMFIYRFSHSIHAAHFSIYLWGALLITSSLWLALLVCPRCGKLFAMKNAFTGWFTGDIFTQHCVHCGLRKYSHGDDAPPAGLEKK